MDEEVGRRHKSTTTSYEKVSLVDDANTQDEDDDSNDDDNDVFEDEIEAGEGNGGGGGTGSAISRRRRLMALNEINGANTRDDHEAQGFLLATSSNRTKSLSKPDEYHLHASSREEAATAVTPSQQPPRSHSTATDIWHRTLIPDTNVVFGEWPLFEQHDGGNAVVVKLLKFIILAFGLISLVHVLVGHFFDDRDRSLALWHIWVYDGELIVRDCVVFFLVGRMWKKHGVDHLAFVGTALLANLYFESQNYMFFLQHSLTLYEMHCRWPWELWVFVAILIPTIGALVAAHVLRAYQMRILLMKLMEMALCILFFMVPMMPSKYFHLHHWYGGWLLGMHANFDTWWSRFAMAWCFGMYVNGIAVYGRDPVLTCEYAYFLTVDLHCPYVNCYLEALRHPHNNTTPVKEMIPVDWRNCSSTDYIP